MILLSKLNDYYIRNTGDIQMNAIDESASGEAVVKGIEIAFKLAKSNYERFSTS